MKKFDTKSITAKLLLVVVGLYFLVALGVTGGHVWMEYRYQKSKIFTDLQGVQAAFKDGVERSLWEMDRQALQTAVNGILGLPSITGINIVNAAGTPVATGGTILKESRIETRPPQVNLLGLAPEPAGPAPKNKALKLFDHTIPLYADQNHRPVLLGQMTVYSSNVIIYTRLKLELLMLALNAALSFATFSIALLWAIRRYLGRPLSALTRAAGEITPENLGTIRIAANIPEGSELQQLEDALNSMVSNLNAAVCELRQTKQNLIENEENLRITLNSIGDGVIATDTDGCITRMNPIAESLTGWKRNEAVGKPLAEIFKTIHARTRHPIDAPAPSALGSAKTGRHPAHPLLVSRGGEEYQISNSGAPIRDRDGHITGMVLVFRDITEEYNLQQQLRQSQKMEAIGQLAGGVAHDFNNMLGGIMGAAELLEGELKDTENARTFHQMILDTSRKAAVLTSKLLAFARKQPQASAAIDLHQVIEESVALLQSSLDRRIQFKTDLQASPSLIIGDPLQLQNALMNLAINASHAMPQGGTITLTSRITDLSETYCTNSTFDLKPGPFIEVEIRDTGEGIPMDILPRIFEPFFTTKAPDKGTGLGLAAVLGTVQQHNGAITAYSEQGNGSSFHIFLPLTGKIKKETTRKTIALPGSGTILVVDDESVMRATGKAILENLGYSVETAENGAAALAVFQKNPERYDAVLLDMIMPVMSGKDCFEAMIKIDPDVCIIISSGFTQEKDIHEMKYKGLHGFIRKPYLRYELSHVLHDTLTGRPRP